jgi:two-component system OmpR family sensor kinase
MLRTLYARLSAVLLLLFIGIGMIYVVVSGTAIEQYLQEFTQHFNRDLARRIVADRNLVAEGRIDREALKSTFSAYMEINPSIEIYLLDRTGRILAYSADPGKVKRQRVDLFGIWSFMDCV